MNKHMGFLEHIEAMERWDLHCRSYEVEVEVKDDENLDTEREKRTEGASEVVKLPPNCS